MGAPEDDEYWNGKYRDPACPKCGGELSEDDWCEECEEYSSED